jgi:hypothetical protein
VTPTFWENAEVSPIDVPAAVPLVLVAVAVTAWPACGTGLTQAKLSSPPASVVAVVCATGIWPSPWPEGSGDATKHWMVKVWLGLLFSVPEMVVKFVVMLLVVEVMTGKFWRWLFEMGCRGRRGRLR